jgi:glycine/D-amino acid oxidase-like deaminating enzyme
VEIKKISHSGKGVHLLLKNGKSVQAKKLVYCTGYETLEMIKEPVAKLYTTYVCISEENLVLKDTLRSTLVWDTHDPYFYLRSTADHRLLIGGADDLYQPADLVNSSKEKKSKQADQKNAGHFTGNTFH